MPEINGRLTCCSCGADLGDADDPYLDPPCVACMRRAEAEEAELDRQIEEEAVRQEEGCDCGHCDASGHCPRCCSLAHPF